MKETEKIEITWDLVRRFIKVVKIYYFGDSKWKARGLFAIMLALCGTTTGKCEYIAKSLCYDRFLKLFNCRSFCRTVIHTKRLLNCVV